jgi:signal transduction histidine kinase/ActR/RegA family two-component response regulator
MNPQGRRMELWPWGSGLLLTVVFCILVITIDFHARNRAWDNLNNHARVVADGLWNFNSLGIREYLRLAVEADNYARLTIVNKDGTVFQEVQAASPSGLRVLLHTLDAVPRVEMTTPVWSHEQVLGWVKAEWIPTTLATHGAVFVLLFLMQVVVVLYCRVLKQKNRLKERVAERTAELSQANSLLTREIEERVVGERQRLELQQSLERSKKMESLGVLAGGVAHDLNNVLSGIVSYPDLLLHDMADDHPLRQAVLTIRDSGLRAAQIVQDLLTLARRGVVKREVVSLNRLIEDYCRSPEYRKFLEGSVAMEVKVELDPDLAMVAGSVSGLKKMLMNLVANAVEAQPEGGRVVISTANRTLDVSDWVALVVADLGEGISAEDRQRIFEPFYTKKVMGRSGTGLGLTVVWGVVEDHRGTIDVDSQPGKGTTITVFLPVCRDLEATAGESTTARPVYVGRGETVLVVDDLPHQREIACAMLKRMNYQPLTAASGEEALSVLRNRSVDLVVLDMIMDGGFDGLDTYEEIIKLHPGQKAFIASGFSESERVREAQRLGVGACLKKPYTMEELGEAVFLELRQERVH